MHNLISMRPRYDLSWPCPSPWPGPWAAHCPASTRAPGSSKPRFAWHRPYNKLNLYNLVKSKCKITWLWDFIAIGIPVLYIRGVISNKLLYLLIILKKNEIKTLSLGDSSSSPESIQLSLTSDERWLLWRLSLRADDPERLSNTTSWLTTLSFLSDSASCVRNVLISVCSWSIFCDSTSVSCDSSSFFVKRRKKILFL